MPVWMEHGGTSLWIFWDRLRHKKVVAPSSADGSNGSKGSGRAAIAVEEDGDAAGLDGSVNGLDGSRKEIITVEEDGDAGLDGTRRKIALGLIGPPPSPPRPSSPLMDD